MQLFKGNRVSLIIIMTAFAFFALVMGTGGRLIYKKELDARHAKVTSEISHGEAIVREFLSEQQRDLFLLQKLADMEQYADSDFRAERRRKQVLDTFSDYVSLYKFVFRIYVLDAAGNEVLSADSPESAGSARASDITKAECFRKAMELEKGQTHIAVPSGPDVPVPLCRIAAPLFDSGDRIKGVMVMDIKLSELFDFLPEGMFMVDGRANSILRKGGDIVFSKVSYSFSGQDGELMLPDENSVHYSVFEFSPGMKWAIALNDDHNTTKLFLLKLVFSSLVIFALYSGIIAVISYMNIKKHSELEATQKAIIFSLANLAEWRDPETGYHLERTRNYGVILARHLAKTGKYRKTITERFMEDLYNSSPLHDMGKVGIRDDVLLKEGSLTELEFEEIKKHVAIGRDILDEIMKSLEANREFLSMSRNIAAYHHEKYDGSGYPEQLKGSEIPLEARIYALCDAYDAIRAKRPYKEPLSHEEAVSRISRARGTHFDPDIVDAFLQCDRDFMEVYETYKFFVESYVSVSDSANHKNLRVEWTDALSVGIKVIDDQHKELIARINNLLEAIVKGKGRKEISGTIKFLEEYIAIHFGAEEAYMAENHYDRYDGHIAQHAGFIEKFNAIKKDYEERGANSETVINLNRHVVEWLISHISRDDRAFGDFMVKAGGPVPVDRFDEKI